MNKQKLDSHLCQNLKRRIRDLRSELSQSAGEMESLRRNIKVTKYGELETEMKMYIDEC